MNHTCCHPRLSRCYSTNCIENRTHDIYSRNFVLCYLLVKIFAQSFRYNSMTNNVMTTLCIIYNFVDLAFTIDIRNAHNFNLFLIILTRRSSRYSLSGFPQGIRYCINNFFCHSINLNVCYILKILLLPSFLTRGPRPLSVSCSLRPRERQQVNNRLHNLSSSVQPLLTYR